MRAGYVQPEQDILRFWDDQTLACAAALKVTITMVHWFHRYASLNLECFDHGGWILRLGQFARGSTPLAKDP